MIGYTSLVNSEPSKMVNFPLSAHNAQMSLHDFKISRSAYRPSCCDKIWHSSLGSFSGSGTSPRQTSLSRLAVNSSYPQLNRNWGERFQSAYFLGR